MNELVSPGGPRTGITDGHVDHMMQWFRAFKLVGPCSSRDFLASVLSSSSQHKRGLKRPWRTHRTRGLRNPGARGVFCWRTTWGSCLC